MIVTGAVVFLTIAGVLCGKKLFAGKDTSDHKGTKTSGYEYYYKDNDHPEDKDVESSSEPGATKAPLIQVDTDPESITVLVNREYLLPEEYIPDAAGRIEAYKRIAAIETTSDAEDVLDELIDRYGDPPPSVSDLVNVSLVRVQATAVGVYEVTQKKDTLVLQVETLDVPMIRGLLVAFNGRVTAGAGNRPYLSVTLQPDEKPLELLQSILKAMADILAAPPEENTGKK